MKIFTLILAGLSASNMAFAGPHFELNCRETKLHGKYKGSQEVWNLRIPLGELSFQSELRVGLTYRFSTSAPGCFGKKMTGTKSYEEKTVKKTGKTTHIETVVNYKLNILGDQMDTEPLDGALPERVTPLLSADACNAEIVQLKVRADYNHPAHSSTSHTMELEKQGALEIGGQATIGFDYAFHFFSYNTQLACAVEFVNPFTDASAPESM